MTKATGAHHLPGSQADGTNATSGLTPFPDLFELPPVEPALASQAASPGIGPLDLAALGEFVFTTNSQGSTSADGTLVVASAAGVGGDIAYVNVTKESNGSYVASSGKLPSSISSVTPHTGAHGGATYDLYSGGKLLFDFQPDTAHPGQYQLSIGHSIAAVGSSGSSAEFFKGSFGDVTVLGWNSTSILLSTTLPGDLPFGGEVGTDIVVSTKDMSKLPGSLPTNTTFTTTGPAPVILGVTVSEVPCFAAGTRLATPHGLRAVEDLQAGDDVLTSDGRAVPIEWVGSRIVFCSRHPHPERVWPVRVRRDAFGADLPSRDLLLSPDHSVFLDGVLIPICELIDANLVLQERLATIRYLHVQLALHDIVLAENLPAETLLDPASRDQFSDAGALHPDFTATALAWEAACAPLKLWGPEVDAARARLAERAAAFRQAA